MTKEDRVSLPRPVSVREALEPTGITIDVREGQTLSLGPLEEHCSGAYRIAHIRDFDEMKELGFIPNHLSEQDAVKAIREDTRRYDEYTRSAAGSCACEGDVATAAVRLRRRDFVDSFAQLLHDPESRIFARQSPAVLHRWYLTVQFVTRVSDFWIRLFRLEDINIADNATLWTLKGVQGLYVNDINMGKNSRLSLLGGGVHVRCHTLNGPIDS